MSNTFRVIQSVSGAIVEGADEIFTEVLDKEIRYNRIRAARMFDERGAIISYGGGNLPESAQDLIERRAILKIIKFIEKAKKDGGGRLNPQLLLAQAAMGSAGVKRNWFQRNFLAFGNDASRFWEILKQINRDNS